MGQLAPFFLFPVSKKDKYFYQDFSFLQVFMPINGYNGQKLIRLVNANTTATTISTMPSVPVITLVK
jgi:hypothetical protein